MCNQSIKHNKFCLNKYLLIENQVQEGSFIKRQSSGTSIDDE